MSYALQQNDRDVHDFSAQRRWRGHIQLGFQGREDKTVLSKMRFEGPLRVQRPFYPEGHCCHLYLLHPPGGVVSGDHLSIRMSLTNQAHALVTSPAAGKIYGADSHRVEQQQQVSIDIEQDCIAEWLPQETIIYNDANGVLDTTIRIKGNGRFIGWDMFCLGLVASNRPFEKGRLIQRFSVYRDEVPLLLERQQIDGGSDSMTAPWGLRANTVYGTFVTTVDQEELSGTDWYDCLKVFVSSVDTLSMTYRLGLLIIRYLGQSAEQGREQFESCREILRPGILNKPAVFPRIWLT